MNHLHTILLCTYSKKMIPLVMLIMLNMSIMSITEL